MILIVRQGFQLIYSQSLLKSFIMSKNSFLNAVLKPIAISVEDYCNDEDAMYERQLADSCVSDMHRSAHLSTNMASLESMCVGTMLLKGLLSQRNYNQESANVLSVLLQNQMASDGYNFTSIDLQSSDSNYQAHQLTLEAAIDWVNKIFQQTVVHTKHTWNATMDFFHGLDSRISKYEQKLEAASSEFKAKSNGLQKTGNRVSLNELWYFFKTGDGQATDLMGDLMFDTNASKYVLVEYTGKVISEMEKLASIISRAKFSDDKQVLSFVKQIEGLKTPSELFDKKYLTGKPLFNVTGFKVTKSKRSKAITIDGKVCSRFAEMASLDPVTQDGSLAHTGLKAGYFLSNGVPVLNTVSNITELVVANEFIYSVNQIGQVIDFGKRYIDGITKYADLASKFATVSNKLIKSLENESMMMSNYTDENSVIKPVISQMLKIVNSYEMAFSQPAKSEVARSLRGAKYCHYLALRMIYNA